LQAHGRLHLERSQGQRCSGVERGGGARLVVAELAVVAACSRRLVANESSDGLHSALARGNDGATRGERVGAQVEERRGGAKR
jgi:hypothetical protein